MYVGFTHPRLMLTFLIQRAAEPVAKTTNSSFAHQMIEYIQKLRQVDNILKVLRTDSRKSLC